MPKVKISDYSTTNSSNTDINSINIDEGCAPSGINNAIREVMVHLKNWQTNASGDGATFASLVVQGTGSFTGAVTLSAGATLSGTNTLSGSNIISGNINSSGTTNTFSGGNILSGTNTISGAAIISGNINSSGTNTFSGSNVISSALGTSASPSIYFTSDTNTGVFSPAADTVAFATGGSERVRITSTGNVGIANNNPGQKLDVTGNIKWSGATYENVYTISDGAAFEIDPANGTIQLITLGANRTPKATNFAAGQAITLMVDDGTAYTLTWTDATFGGSGVVWKTNAGVAPTLNTTGYTVIVLWKVGTQVYGARVGDA